MLNVWCREEGNAAGVIAQRVAGNGSDLSSALPWVEPSINNLWLEACSSFLLGNYQASIVTTSVLLELTLRMVLTNDEHVPYEKDERLQISRWKNLEPVLSEAKRRGFLYGASKKWWEAYCKHIRNKICHGDLLYILDDCRSIEQFRSYFDPSESPDNATRVCYEHLITHPAVFHHKSGRRFAKAFLDDAHAELSALISLTRWGEYDDHWKSQKQVYDDFFGYEWNYETLKQGIQEARRPFGASAK